MEKQIILCAGLDDLNGFYFSRWEYGKRIPGSLNPYTALFRNNMMPYKNEKLGSKDFVVLIESLIKWSEE